MSLRIAHDDLEERRERLNAWLKVFLFLVFILLGRLFYLQVIRGSYFKKYALENSLKPIRIDAPRGLILDRYKTMVASSEPAFNLVSDAHFVRAERQGFLANLANLLELNASDLESGFKNGSLVYGQRIVMRGLSKRMVSLFKARQWEFAPVQIDLTVRRTYLWDEVGSHVIGYVGSVGTEELDYFNRQVEIPYQAVDVVGKYGVEQSYEKVLRSYPGLGYVQVDANGRRLVSGKEILGINLPPGKSPATGNGLVLSIDQSLQNKAYQLLRGKVGVVVALDAKTGEVLSLISSPAFSPNAFSQGISRESWAVLQSNPAHPLLNRAIQSGYAPGSVFKLITTFGLLSEKLLSFEKTVYCDGTYKFGNRLFHCWKKNGHGLVHLKRAITESCDVFFYHLANEIGPDRLYEYARLFGFGERSGIDLGGEISGFVPSTKWKKEALKSAWFPGETLSYAIGQGYLVTTPLQVALAYTAIVNGGKLLRPLFVKEILDSSGKVKERVQPQIRREIAGAKYLTFLREAVTDVVNMPGGTAYWTARSSIAKIGGKTGTTQVVGLSRDELYQKCEQLELNRRHNSWFVGHAPAEDPKIVIVAMVEHGCSGSKSAAPIVKELIEYYWSLSNAPAKITAEGKNGVELEKAP